MVRTVSELTPKADWIYNRLGDTSYTADDVYDVLLGNITEPQGFVNAVTSLATEYDWEKDTRFRQSGGLDSASPRSGLFSYVY